MSRKGGETWGTPRTDVGHPPFEKGFDYGLSHSEAVIARGYEDLMYAEE